MPDSSSFIREFLVSIGYYRDQKSEQEFNKSLIATTKYAVELGLAIELTAAGVVAGVAKITRSLEGLYFASQRTRASVEGIQALGYAASQLGATGDAALGSLENLSLFIRSNPGAEGLLNSLGVQTRDANGSFRDLSATLGSLGTAFAKMPEYRAIAYANFLGIDYKTLTALRSGEYAGYVRQYADMARRAGYSAQQAATDSHSFWVELRSLGAVADIARNKLAGVLARGLAGDFARLRETILKNIDPIVQFFSAIAKGILFAANVITTFIVRGVQLWNGLDVVTKTYIKTVGILIAAWRTLNLAFLASPLGIITALAAALLLLYDDYKVWKEGGLSEFKWDQFDAALKRISDTINKIVDGLRWILGVKDDAGQKAIESGQEPNPGGETLGIRNNNPGNLRQWGNAPIVHGFAAFATAQEGLRAMADNLETYAKRGWNTVRSIIMHWAPASDNNDTEAYIRDVASRLGVSPDAPLDLTDTQTVGQLMDAIIRHENSGKDPYYRTQREAAAYGAIQSAHLTPPQGNYSRPLFPPGGVRSAPAPTLNQTNNVTVHGVSDPHEAANHIGRVLDRRSADMVRNLKGALA